jgi:hypothetical protein
MEYALLFIGEETERQSPDRDAIYQKIFDWFGDLGASGRLRDARELQPTSTATTVRLPEAGEPVVTDGPFIESKEVIGGYAIVDCADLDEALAIAKSWPSPGATVEVRPIVAHGES